MVCDNQDVTLMCHTDQTTGNITTWYCPNQSRHEDTITVVARMTEIFCTCVVIKDGQYLGHATVVIKANGKCQLSILIHFFGI